MVRKRNAVKEPGSKKNGKKKWSWKKKTLIFGSPFFLLIIFVGVFFLYQMSRSYVEPEYDQPLAGLKSDLLPKPETGVPADYTPEENAAIAEYVLMNTEHYQSTMDAQVTASVGFINYDQQVRNTKVVDGDSIFAQALSLSSMVKVGEQKYFNKGIYLLRQATDVQSVEQCTWSDDISAMSADTYANRYGRTPDGLSNYLITKDTIVKGEYLGEQDGLYVYKYELDPKESAALYWHQIKTLSGSDKTPLFHEVQLTLYLDKDWRPQKTEIHENYDVSMPVIGMATCDGNMVEVFHDYDVAAPIPDQALFQKYIDEEYDPNNLTDFKDGSGEDTDIMGYISKIFKTDENGKATLALDFTINDGAPQRAYVEIDTKNMAFKLKWDSLLIGYENERIYLKFGNIKYYLSQDDLMEVLQEITSQIGVEMPSMEELMSEDTLNQLMENVQMLESDGKMNIVVKMDGIEALVNMTSDMQFLGAHATINLDGFKMKLSASEAPAQNIEGFDDSYQDIRSVLEFSEPIINLINARTYAFTFRVDMDGENTLHQDVSVRVSRHNTELASCLIDANVNGKWLHVRIVGNKTYLSYGDLKFTFDTRDLGEIIEQVSKVIPADELDLSVILPQAYLDLFTNLDLNAIANSIQSLEMSGDNLAVNMKVGDDLIQAQVGRVGGQLSGAHLSGVTVLGSKLTLNAKMTAVSNYPGTLPVNPAGYTDLKGLAGFVGPVVDLINANTYDFAVNLNLDGDVNVDHTALVHLVRGDGGLSAKVSTELFGHTLDLRLVNGVTYLQYGNVKLKLDTKDIGKLTEAILAVLPEDAKKLDLSKVLPQSYLEVLDRDLFEWLDSIDSVEITDRVAALTIRIGDDNIKLSVNRDDKAITGAKIEGATIFNSKAALTLRMLGFSQAKTPVEISEPDTYTDLSRLTDFIAPVKQLLDARTYEIDLSAQLSGKVNWAQDAKLYVVRTDSGVNLELSAQVSGVPVDVRLIGSTAYLQCGNVKLKLNTTDLDEITEQLKDVLPKDASDFDLTKLLPKEYVKLIEKPTVEKLIDCVQGLTVNGDVLTLSLRAGDDVIPVSVTKQGDALHSVSVSGLTVLDSKVNLTARLAGLSNEPRTIAVDDSEYSDLKELAAFLPDILELINSNSFGFAVDVRLTEPFALSTTLRGKLVRTSEKDIALDLSANIEGEELSLRFVGQCVYVKYGNLKLMLDTRDLDEIMEEVKEILPEEWQQVNWKEWIPEQYLDLIENPDIPALIGNIQTLTTKDGKLTFRIQLADTLATLEAVRGQNDKKLDVSLTFEQAKTVSGAVKTETGVQGVSTVPSGYRFHVRLDDYAKETWRIRKPTENYLNVKKLLPFVKPVINMIQARAYECDLELTLFQENGDETVRVPAHLALERTDKGVNLRVTADVFGQDLEFSLIDSTAYVSYAGLDVKVKTKDFKKLGRQIDSLLPKGWSLDLDSLLPKSYQKLIKNPSPWAILGALSSLDVEDGDTLLVKLKVGSDHIQLRAVTDGETLTYLEAGGVTVLGQTVFITMRDLELGKPSSTDSTVMDWDVDADAYQEVSEVIDLVKPILNIIDAKSWKFKAAIELDGETYLIDVQLALGKNNELTFSAVSEDLAGVPLCIEHTAKITYIHYANIELYLKDADLETVLKRLEEILPEGIDLSGVLDFGDSFDLDSLDLAGLLGSVRDISFRDNTFSLSVDLGDDTVDLTVVNGEKYPESITVNGLLDHSLGLEISGLEVNGGVSVEAPPLDSAVNVVDLIDCLEPTLNILRADDCTAELTVMGEYQIDLRKVEDKIYLTYHDNPVIALVMDVSQAEVLTDLIGNIMDLVDAIDQFKDDPDVSAGEVQDVLEQGKEQDKIDVDQMVEILQSLTLEMTGEHTLAISLTVDGKPMNITASTMPENDKFARLTVSSDTETYAELKVTSILLPQGGSISSRPNDKDYVAVDQIAQFVQPVTNLLNAKAYAFDVTVDMEEDLKDKLSGFWDGTLHVKLNRDTPKTVSAQVTATLFQDDEKLKRELVITYVDDTVALQYGDEINVKLDVSEEGQLIQEIKTLFEEQTGEEPSMDYTAFVPQSYVDFIQQFLPEDGTELSEKEIVLQILKRIKHLNVQNDIIKVGFAMGADGESGIVNASVSIDPAKKRFTVISLDGLQLLHDSDTDTYGNAGVRIDVTAIDDQILDKIVIAENFADLDHLAGLIQPVYNLLKGDSYHFEVMVDVAPEAASGVDKTDLTESLDKIWPDRKLDVKLERDKTDPDKEKIRAQVKTTFTFTDDKDSTKKQRQDLIVTYTGDMVYLDFGTLKAKLDVSEIDGSDSKKRLIQAIQDVVESGTQDPQDKEAAKKIPYDKFLPSEYVDVIEAMLPADGQDLDLMDMARPLLERFQALRISENSATIDFDLSEENTLSATVALDETGKLGVDVTGLKLLSYEKKEDANKYYHDTTLNLTVLNDNAAIDVESLQNDAAYFDLDSLADYVEPVAQLLKAKAYEFDIDLKVGEGQQDPTIHISKQANVKIVRRVDKDGNVLKKKTSDGKETDIVDVQATIQEFFGGPLTLTYWNGDETDPEPKIYVSYGVNGRILKLYFSEKEMRNLIDELPKFLYEEIGGKRSEVRLVLDEIVAKVDESGKDEDTVKEENQKRDDQIFRMLNALDNLKKEDVNAATVKSAMNVPNPAYQISYTDAQIASIVKLLQQEQHESSKAEQEFDEAKIRSIIQQLLPDAYAKYFEKDGLSVGNLIELAQRLSINDAGKDSFNVTLKVDEDNTITASVSKRTNADGSVDLDTLGVSGIKILGSSVDVSASSMKYAEDPSAMQKSIGDSLTDNGYVDLFGGLGEDKQGVLIKALTDKLVDSPLNLTFSITEIDEQNGKTEITHNANTYVTQKTAYAGYKSSKGVQEMKVKIDYTSIEQLLPSIINLLQIDIDQYPALDKLAQSVGVDSKEGVIKSEVLQSLFGGVFDKNDLSFETDTDLLAKDTVKKAVKKIVWTDDEITIWLDNNVLYGDGISQTQKNGYLTVIVKKAVGGDLTIELKNVHGSDTKTLNLEIGVKSTDQATINGLSGYMDFSSINQIYADIANTASFGEYHLNGDITLNLKLTDKINLMDVVVPTDIKIILDEKNNLKQIFGTIGNRELLQVEKLGAKIFVDPSYTGSESPGSVSQFTSPYKDEIVTSTKSGGGRRDKTKTEVQTQHDIQTAIETKTQDRFEFDTAEIIYDASPSDESGLNPNTLYIRRRFKVLRRQQTRTHTKTIATYQRERTSTGKWQTSITDWIGSWKSDGKEPAWESIPFSLISTNQSTTVSGWSSWNDFQPVKDANGNQEYAYEYVTLDFKEMGKATDPTLFVMNYVYYVLPFNTNAKALGFISINIQQTINEQIANKTDPDGAAVIENILNNFEFNNSTYSLDINPVRLIQDGRFRPTLPITLTRSPVKEGKNGAELQGDTPHILSQFSLNTQIVPIGKDYLVTIDWAPTLANYNGSTLTGLKNKDGVLSEVPGNITQFGDKKTQW